MAEEIEIKLNIKGQSIKSFRDELKKTKQQLEETTDPKEFEKLEKKFKEGSKLLVSYNKSLRDTAQATEQVSKSNKDLDATFEEVYGDVKPLSSRLGELEDRMYELALAGNENSEEFRTMQKEAVRMRKTIIAVDKQVDILADNQGFSVFGDGLASVGASLMRLDFDTASKQASSLASAAGKISFGSAIKSIKQLGSVFLNLGKAMLANPLFLMAAIIGAIIAVIVKLMDELGFLTAIFNAIGDAIGWVIQQLKDFLDWLGLTNYAEQDAAEQSAQAAEKRAKAYEQASKRIVQALDQEIRLAELAGESTQALEADRLQQIKKGTAADVEALRARLKAERLKGDMNHEELMEIRTQLEDKKLLYQQNINDIEFFNAEQVKLQKDNIKAIQDAIDEGVKEGEEKRKEAYDNWKAFRDERISAEREIQDAELDLMDEGTEKELQANKLKFDRLIEDTKNNESLIQSERLRLIDLYGQERVQAENEINQQIINQQAEAVLKAQEFERQARNNFLNELEAWNEEQYQKSLSEEEQEIIAIQDKYFRLLELARQHGEDLTALEEAQQSELSIIQDKYDKERETKQKDADAKELADRKTLENAKIDLASNVLAAVSANLEQGSKSAKAIAVAQATMDTYRGAVAAFASTAANPISIAFPAAPYLAAASAVAMGIGNVRNILKTDNSGTTVGGTPSAATATPPVMGSQQQAEPTPTMNLNEGIEQNAGGSVERQKVWVVDYTDIENKGDELVQVKNSFTLA